MINRIYSPDHASVCFFRSSVKPPYKKIMLQITERCNLKCAHCFVDSESTGNEIPFEHIRDSIIPELIKNQVVKITLTGGEPFVHKDIEKIIGALVDNGVAVSICTNGILPSSPYLESLSGLTDKIHFNVSLDGFKPTSHGRFRGNLSERTFDKILSNIRLMGELRLLNGILCTPNHYATIDEYREMCQFAKEVGAKYVLMNPLSPFGRGNRTLPLAYTSEEMDRLKQHTRDLQDESFEIVYIRFPNTEGLPVAPCTPGAVPYIFCNGDIAICPYMVFAADDIHNNYQSKDFIIGNIFDGVNLSDAIHRHLTAKTFIFRGETFKLNECLTNGCNAIKISHNESLSAIDKDI